MKILCAVLLNLMLIAQAPANVKTGTEPQPLWLFQAGESYSDSSHRSETNGLTLQWRLTPSGGIQAEVGGVFSVIPEGVSYPKGRFTMVVLPEKTLRPGDGSLAVLLVNDTDEVQRLATWTMGLRCRQEAKDNDGQWRPIEYEAPPMMPLGCALGNDPKDIAIPPHGCFAFPARRYRGSVATRMRMVIGKELNRGDADLVSNEYEGSINPGQFSMGYDLSGFVLCGPDSDPSSVRYIPDDAIVKPKLAGDLVIDPPLSVKHALKGCNWPPGWLGQSEEIGEAPARSEVRNIIIQVSVNAKGCVTNTSLAPYTWKEIPEEWVQAMAHAVGHSKFHPAMVEGKPVPSQCSQVFGLDCRPAAFLGAHAGFNGYLPQWETYLHVVIGSNGRIKHLEKVEPHGELSREDLTEVRIQLDKVRFAPATINGVPVDYECLLIQE